MSVIKADRLKNERLVVNVEEGDVIRWFYVTTKAGLIYSVCYTHHTLSDIIDIEVTYSDIGGEPPEDIQAVVKEAVFDLLDGEQ